MHEARNLRLEAKMLRQKISSLGAWPPTFAALPATIAAE
jgi:hypothetical protein